MKKLPLTSLLLCLLMGLLLYALSGCGILPQPRLSAGEHPAPASLSLPEDMLLTWDPAAAAVEQVEVVVSEGGPDHHKYFQICGLGSFFYAVSTLQFLPKYGIVLNKMGGIAPWKRKRKTPTDL